MTLRNGAWFVLLNLVVLKPVNAHDYGKVELLRDSWGVPHVFAESDAAAMCGLGYATGEDRAFQMTYTLRIIQGRLAEVLGDIPHTRRNETALDNDRKMRTFGFARVANRRVEELDSESIGLLEAYSAGVNAYIAEATASQELNPLFAKVGLEPEPWTPADCLLAWWHLAQFFATDGTRDLMHYRNLVNASGLNREQQLLEMMGRDKHELDSLQRILPDESAAVVGRDDVSDAWLEQTHAFMRQYGFDQSIGAAIH